MWQHVAKGFEILLSGKIYPTLGTLLPFRPTNEIR
jgi:hypothetical protein